MKTPGSNTVRQTLLNFKIDPNSRKELKALMADLEKLEKEAQDIGKTFRNNVREIERGALTGSVKTETGQYRKTMLNIQGTASSLMGEITKELSTMGFPKGQLAQITKSFEAGMSELTGKFTAASQKSFQVQSAKLKDYYDAQFRARPATQRFDTIRSGQIGTASQEWLKGRIASNKVYLAGANQAHKDAIASGNGQMEKTAAEAIQRLTANTEKASARIKQLEQASKQSQSQMQKEVRYRDFYAKQFRQNPANRGSRMRPGEAGSYRDPAALEARIATQQQWIAGARSAVKHYDNVGDSKNHRRAVRDLDAFEKELKESQAALKMLKEAVKEAAREEKQRIKKAAEPTPEQKRVTRAVERIQQNDTNRRIDNGASQFKNQATLLRNYAVMGGGLAAAGTSAFFAVDLDRQFKQLQSIVALTNDEMEELSTNLIDVSEKTKFTATDVTDAAIVLGQAGLGKNDIQNALEGVTLFATAVGSDLKSAVDLATSTLGVFNKDSSQMVDIVDKMTTAVNSSKLNLDKLALGLQYSGNLAAQSNITFEETVSALGAMANSGIRAGSTLGTGLRQIIIALQKPSDTFKTKIHDLGLSMGDLDVSSHGLIEVLKTLSQAGFTVRDAMETMQVRAASAYGAFANNIDVADELNKKMRIGGSAARANATQMQSLGNQMDRLGSISKSIVYESLEPLLGTVTKLTEKTADFLSVLREVSGVLSMVAVPAAILGTVLSARSVMKLGGSLLGGVGALAGGGGISGAMGAMGKGLPMAGLLRGIGLMNPWVAGATALGTAGVFGYEYLDGQARSADRVDNTQSEVNRAQSSIERYDAQLKKVNASMDTLILKQNSLADESRLKAEIRNLNSEFKQQGLYIDASVDSYDKLMEKMREFKNNTADAAQYLKENSRTGLRENSIAMRDDLFSSSYFESDAEGIARKGLMNTSGSGRSFTNRSAMFMYRLLEQANPEFKNNLASNIEAIRNIEPGTAGARQDIASAQANTQGLARELVSLASDPERLKKYFEAANIQGSDLQEQVTESLNNVAAELFSQANTLMSLESNEELYISRDPKTLAKKRELSESIQTNYVDVMLNQAADIKKQLNGLEERNKNKETRDFFGTYFEMRDIFDTRMNELVGIEDEAIAELEKQGVENPKQYLSQIGFYKNFGLAQGQLISSLRNTAKDAQPDADVRFPDEIKVLQGKISTQRDLLRNVTDEAESATILAKVNALVQQLEEVRAQQELFAADLKNVSPPTEERRKRNVEVRTQAEVTENERIQTTTLTRSRIAARLAAQQGLNLSETKLNDDELSKLLSEYLTGQQKAIKTAIADAKNQAEQLRYEAEQEQLKADEYTQIGNNANVSDGTRERSLMLARAASNRAGQLRQQALQLEQDAVKDAKTAINELAEYIRTEIVDNPNLSSGRSKTKASKGVEDLQATSTDLTGDLQELSRETDRTRRETEKFSESLSQAERNIRKGPYSSGEFAKNKAYIQGRRYNPDGSPIVDEGTYSADQDIGSQLRRGGNYLFSELETQYENYDGLTDMIMGATEMAKGLGSEFGNVMTSLVTNVESTDNAFKSMFQNILAGLAQMASQAAFKELMSLAITGVQAFAGTGAGPGPSAGRAYTGKHIIAGSYYDGGHITSGVTSRDSTYAKVAKGEFVLRRRAVQALGLANVQAINAADPSVVKSNELAAAKGGGTMMAQLKETEVNVWVVSKEEVPNETSGKDTIHIVADDIQRGGVLRQLIRTVKV